jgi:hypothetical protein
MFRACYDGMDLAVFAGIFGLLLVLALMRA